jgi:hypothetical protein
MALFATKNWIFRAPLAPYRIIGSWTKTRRLGKRRENAIWERRIARQTEKGLIVKLQVNIREKQPIQIKIFANIHQ